MKTLCTLAFLILTTAFSEATAQDTSRVDLALGYTYIHSNAPPSICGCFSFNGGSASASWKFNPQWSVAAEFGGAHAGSIDKSGISPTLTTFLFGPRYSIAKGPHPVVPFGNILAGAAHASNGYFPSGTSSSTTATGFAMSAGGGIDISAGKHLAVRAVEAEYLLTRFPNGINGRQNNFRITSGIVFRFGGH